MKSLSFSLYQCLTAFSLGLLLTSCTTAHIPQHKYLVSTSLSGIYNVAVLVTIFPSEVVHSQTKSSNWTFPLFGLLGVLIESSIRSDIDKSHAEKINKDIYFSIYEEKLGKTFIKTLMESARFKSVDYKKDNKLDNHQLLLGNYDAVIRLFVDNISFYKVSNEDVKLSVSIVAKMVELKSSKIIWDRDDSIVASENHTIEYYEKNGLQELNSLLVKAGKKLADDILYLY